MKTCFIYVALTSSIVLSSQQAICSDLRCLQDQLLPSGRFDATDDEQRVKKPHEDEVDEYEVDETSESDESNETNEKTTTVTVEPATTLQMRILSSIPTSKQDFHYYNPNHRQSTWVNTHCIYDSMRRPKMCFNFELESKEREKIEKLLSKSVPKKVNRFLRRLDLPTDSLERPVYREDFNEKSILNEVKGHYVDKRDSLRLPFYPPLYQPDFERPSQRFIRLPPKLESPLDMKYAIIEDTDEIALLATDELDRNAEFPQKRRKESMLQQKRWNRFLHDKTGQRSYA